jgi:hypothetical protein
LKKSAQETGLHEYLGAIKHNLNAPIPKFVQSFDSTIKLLFSYPKYDHDLASLQMFILAHSTLKSAVVLNIGGATAQVIPLLRHPIECAMYGYIFWLDRSIYDAWSKRELDNARKNLARNKLQFKGMISAIEKKNKKLAQGLREYYELLLTLGAHPNVAQFSPLHTTIMSETEDQGDHYTAYLTDEPARKDNWDYFVGSYRVVLAAFRDIFPEEYLLLGIEASRRDSEYWYDHFSGRISEQPL